ncbi:MAG: alpha/beta fold hydrolase [Thermogemmatispora sp.]|uniref:alpha/beta hydrolase n=1 Tax=Thermogemmatispora sp. TaxID=1968838 RepID=UPI001DFB545A|nr:alpha/beta fold hydrolase [Thermogemmatispora sp.]MBX5449523.1 alpha/beta fold hydrolase [Thermogemmatispora sp.]
MPESPYYEYAPPGLRYQERNDMIYPLSQPEASASPPFTPTAPAAGPYTSGGAEITVARPASRPGWPPSSVEPGVGTAPAAPPTTVSRRSPAPWRLILVILLVALVLFAGGVAAYLVLAIRAESNTTGAQPTGGAKVAVTPGAGTQAATTANFHQGPCPFQPGAGIVQGRDLICGTLTVPEDRSQPQGNTIRLAVAIFKAATPQAADATPFLYLSGGPGGATLSDLGSYINQVNRQAVTLGRTFILFDQRGTGYSSPSLYCGEVDRFNQQTKDENLSHQANDAGYLQAMRSCRDRLTAEGVHLSAYTTIEDAQDVHDLIHALGYRQVDLYGVSYGTRLALTVMRLFPQDLRSVILDSTVPTQSNLFTTLSASMQHAFDTLFKGCQADPFCRESYPNLQTTFYRLVNRLNAHPVTINDLRYGPILLTGDGFAQWVFASLYVTSFIPELPRAISEIDHGQYTLIAETYGELLLAQDISYGMYYSVECGEDMRYTSLQELDRSVSALRPELQPGMLDSLELDYRVCQLWNVPSVPPEQKQPVTSSLPTLILSGEYDPITPTSNALLAQKTLSHSYLFVFPGTGHGVFLTSTCANLIMSQFLADPEVQPSNSCISSMEEPNFI